MRKNWLLAAAMLAPMGLTGCGDGVSSGYKNSSGSLALSNDDALVYATGSVPMRPPVPGIDSPGVYGAQPSPCLRWNLTFAVGGVVSPAEALW